MSGNTEQGKRWLMNEYPFSCFKWTVGIMKKNILFGKKRPTLAGAHLLFAIPVTFSFPFLVFFWLATIRYFLLFFCHQVFQLSIWFLGKVRI
jgi:hypothetical protein